jgi:hypothetical protein
VAAALDEVDRNEPLRAVVAPWLDDEMGESASDWIDDDPRHLSAAAITAGDVGTDP